MYLGCLLKIKGNFCTEINKKLRFLQFKQKTISIWEGHQKITRHPKNLTAIRHGSNPLKGNKVHYSNAKVYIFWQQ